MKIFNKKLQILDQFNHSFPPKLNTTNELFCKLQSLFCRQNSQDNCLLSNVNLGFSDNFDDILSDPQWDLYRQFNDLQCSSDLDDSSGKSNKNIRLEWL